MPAAIHHPDTAQPEARIWVKICANTSAADALLAAELGADAVGFVFAPSSRRVTPAQVREIATLLPATVERIGVFPTASPAQIAEAAVEARLHAVQLHGGNLTPQFLEELTLLLGPAVTLVPTLHWSTDPAEDSAAVIPGQLAALAPAGEPSAQPPIRILIDARVGASPSGGTGRSFDWNAARPAFAPHPARRLILAGGLTPETVAGAIRMLHPWGVDVASGVEQSPGRKDPTRLRNFMQKARGA